jgi:acylphosphatase
MRQEDERTTRVIYSGRVQGVGFRATTRSIARRYDVAGYVRNQSDGTVELVARGSAEEVRGFLDAVWQRFRTNITNSHFDAMMSDEVFESFDIRR